MIDTGIFRLPEPEEQELEEEIQPSGNGFLEYAPIRDNNNLIGFCLLGTPPDQVEGWLEDMIGVPIIPGGLWRLASRLARTADDLEWLRNALEWGANQIGHPIGEQAIGLSIRDIELPPEQETELANKLLAARGRELDLTGPTIGKLILRYQTSKATEQGHQEGFQKLLNTVWGAIKKDQRLNSTDRMFLFTLLKECQSNHWRDWCRMWASDLAAYVGVGIKTITASRIRMTGWGYIEHDADEQRGMHAQTTYWIRHKHFLPKRPKPRT